MRGRKHSWVLVAIFVLAGVFIGNRAGEALHAVIPVAANYSAVAIETRSIQLLDLSFPFGIAFRINLMGAVGALAGIFLVRRV